MIINYKLKKKNKYKLINFIFVFITISCSHFVKYKPKYMLEYKLLIIDKEQEDSFEIKEIIQNYFPIFPL